MADGKYKNILVNTLNVIIFSLKKDVPIMYM